jgi:dTDP-4-dehydrorhamnose 3,5-epimerase
MALRPRAMSIEVLPQAPRDEPTVDADGRRLDSAIEGVVLERLVAHHDHRGALAELIDVAKPFWAEPIVYAYAFSVRPGRIKGWGMHKLQADRYAVMSGSLRVVLHDGRVDSPSFRRFAEFHFTDATPGLLRIPPGVWHADQNWGATDVRVVNFPTRAYDHAEPDKYRIDPASGEIPFDFSLRDG